MREKGLAHTPSPPGKNGRAFSFFGRANAKNSNPLFNNPFYRCLHYSHMRIMETVNYVDYGERKMGKKKRGDEEARKKIGEFF